MFVSHLGRCSLFLLVLTAPAVCQAKDPFKNTPFDPGTWRIPVRPPQDSTLPVEPSRPETWFITNAASGRVLDAASDGRVIQWRGHGGANQQWRITRAGDGTVRITNAANGLVLDAASDGRVIQWQGHGGANQQWRITRAGDGTVRITNAASGRVLDAASDGRVIQWQATAGQPTVADHPSRLEDSRRPPRGRACATSDGRGSRPWAEGRRRPSAGSQLPAEAAGTNCRPIGGCGRSVR
jgi:predicted secreted protein